VREKNTELAQGIPKFGRSQAISKSGRWRFFKKGADGKKTEKKVPTTKEGKPKTRKQLTPKFYEPYTRKTSATKKKKSKKVVIPKLRASITPGTVLIILAGRFRGRRVVFLNQLPTSGLLLVTGPYKLNGVPIRRINQAYVIATSTKVDLSKVTIPEDITDKTFARVKSEKAAEGTSKEEQFFNKQNKAPAVNQEWLAKRKENQKKVDTAILAAIKTVPELSSYLSSSFSLSKHEAPHKIVF